MTEEWRPLDCGNYAVSNAGRVKRLTPGRRTEPGRLMCAGIAKNGYPTVSLTRAGKVSRVYVHHLVAAAFLGPRPPGSVINHKDGDKTNGRDANLEYVSQQGNMRHAASTGLVKFATTISSETAAEIIRRRRAGESYERIARATSVSVERCWTIARKALA